MCIFQLMQPVFWKKESKKGKVQRKRDLLQVMHYSYFLITVTVNGEFVAKEDYEEHEVPDNADVTVFHLAHGG